LLACWVGVRPIALPVCDLGILLELERFLILPVNLKIEPPVLLPPVCCKGYPLGVLTVVLALDFDLGY
jgi:hypothetical protein